MGKKIGKEISKREVCLSICILGIILIVVYMLVSSKMIRGKIDDTLRYIIDMSVTRMLGGIIFLSMLINLGYRVLNPIKKPFAKSLLLSLPAFLIAVNNFPFSQVISGEVVLVKDAWMIPLLLLECLCVGFFEETAFRGVVFLGILKKKPQSKVWAFVSIVISSVIFGLVHLLNIFEGDPVAVLMQIGYSSLIGAMCAVVLLKTANIWMCVVIHGLFNFSGSVMTKLGRGEIWDDFTVWLTVAVSVAVTGYMIWIFLKDEMKLVDDMFPKKSK